MRRRALLTAGAATVTAALLPSGVAFNAPDSTGTVADALLGRITTEPIAPGQLGAQLDAARADYRATRYLQLGRRLPHLLAQAAANDSAAPPGRTAAAADQLAQAYTVAAQLLAQRHDDVLAGATADRATDAASRSGDPATIARAHRITAIVMRRTHHRDGAHRLILDAARQFDIATGLVQPDQLALYGQLLATAAHSAAVRADRDAARTLLHEAEHIARCLGTPPTATFGTLDVAAYRLRVARVLGDYGVANDLAALVDPARIAAPVRRARYWQDTALARQGSGRPAAAFNVLLTVERDTPQEVRCRPWARQLTLDLIGNPASGDLPGLLAFASRVGLT
jgi:hypothetical protein